MSLLLPLYACAGHEGKSRATTGERRRRRREGFTGEGGTLDMFLYKCPACISQTKAPPSRFLPHFCLLCLFSFSPRCLSLSLSLSLSNHRPGTVWVNEGLDSTLPPLQASIQLGKDCPLLWWDTVANPPSFLNLFLSANWFRKVYLKVATWAHCYIDKIYLQEHTHTM